MNTSVFWLVALLALSLAATGKETTTVPTGLQRQLVFNVYPQLADNAALLRRLVSPLHAYRAEQRLTDRPAALHARPLDPTQQHFALYVPPGPPPADGYGLLVFVPPWDDARVPRAWIPVLNRKHVIYVSAAHSGNDADVLDRREPLALLAEYNVAKRYPVDPARIYVGGFSGGSRIALRLALAYPDVFRGALLDAGSDPIGNAQVPLPPASLFHLFQESSRIVFMTGELDTVHATQRARAADSLRRWCVFDTDSITLLRTGHTLADAAGFARALDALSHATAPDDRKLAACRSSIDHALDSGLRKVRSLMNAGRFMEARHSLDAVDARYGGLAAPQSVALLRTLDKQSAPNP